MASRGSVRAPLNPVSIIAWTQIRTPVGPCTMTSTIATGVSVPIPRYHNLGPDSDAADSRKANSQKVTTSFGRRSRSLLGGAVIFPLPEFIITRVDVDRDELPLEFRLKHRLFWLSLIYLSGFRAGLSGIVNREFSEFDSTTASDHHT